MFTKISKITLFAVVAISFFTLSSCKKDKDKNLEVHFNYKVGTESFDYNNTYTINGTAIKFSTVQFYVSGITLMDDASNMAAIEDKYLLVKPEQHHYEVGLVPESFGDHLHMFNFNIGIDAATNSQSETDFTSRESTDPLAAQSPAMHWSWNSGYIFLRIDAMVDTSGDGTPDTNAEFHIGTDNFVRAGSVMIHSDLEVGDNDIAINFDVAALFDGIDLSTEYDTHTMDNMPLATKVADNLADAFSKAN